MDAQPSSGLGTDRIDAEAVRSLAPQALYSLQGKVAVVTGAGGGIGRWLVSGLGAAGASVLLTDREQTGMDEIAATLQAAGVAAETLVVDLQDDDAPERVVATALDRFGQLDILINNAGINKRMPILEVDRATFDTVFDVDWRAPYFLSQAAARAMIDRGGGAIVNISSLNNAVGLEDVSLLGPTKAALSQLTRVMAIEWSRYGIRANALAPGFMDTPINVAVWTDDRRSRWIMQRVPMERPGHPRELVGMCVLLASDAASFITGQTFYVDGGFLAGSRWNA